MKSVYVCTKQTVCVKCWYVGFDNIFSIFQQFFNRFIDIDNITIVVRDHNISARTIKRSSHSSILSSLFLIGQFLKHASGYVGGKLDNFVRFSFLIQDRVISCLDIDLAATFRNTLIFCSEKLTASQMCPEISIFLTLRKFWLNKHSVVLPLNLI